MKSIMASDYVLPRKGFFSQHQNHSFNHALMNPLSNDHKPQPKRYNPNPYPAETITWTKPDHDPFETSYRAAFKDISSGKITGRTTEREVIVDRNLTASLIPKNFPSYSQKKNVPHHVSGIYGRDFSENPRPAKTQYPNVKYIDNMATTSLALTTARTREASASPMGRHHAHGPKTAANVLRAIYTNKSDLAEHIREDHDDPHLAEQNMINKELLKEDLVKYVKVFSGRAGSSSISKRMDTIAPKKKERRDVSNSEHIKKLMNNTYAAERDYKQVDRDFKYSYVAACHSRHPVADKSYTELDSSRYGRGRSYTGGRIMAEDYYSKSRSRTPELGAKREEKSSKKSRKETESSTPVKAKKSKSSKDTTPRSTRSAAGPMSVNKLIKKYV